MFDAPAPTLQRSHGAAAVTLGPEGLRRLAQSGSAKAMLPRGPGPAEVVFLNTSGGLTGGDRLDLSLTLAAGTTAVATTQTAERAYRAEGPPARVRVALAAGAGAWLDWLPQETILFDGAALDRETTVDLGPGAGCLMVETLVLGRAAMGETVCRLHLREARTVRRAGRPVAAERLALDDAALARPGAAMLAGARAIATLIRIDPAAPPPLAAARAALCEPGVIAAASAAGERLVVRLAAADGFPLRRQIARLLAALRPGPLPRVWQGTLA